jgi:UDP-GlcNAc3NAcA epimerase
MKILTVVGARPQFIKAAPVSRALRPDHLEILVHTGQHYDEAMSDVFFTELNIPQPDVNLGVGSGSHGEQTAAMLAALEAQMIRHQPDWVLLYGDTNSTLAGALAAAKLNLRVAHVEAGLRSFNRTMPEEINRVLTDHVSALLFCPTDAAVENLKQEGITAGVHRVGDVMTDALMDARHRIAERVAALQDEGIAHGSYFLATIHRPANTDDPSALRGIVEGFAALEHPIVLPVHPRLKAALAREHLSLPENVIAREPASYLTMIALLDGAELVITDSGGLQKETYIMHRPCITVRPETEWVETVESGWNRLADPTPAALLEAVSAARTVVPKKHPDFYGDGRASHQIVALLAEHA